MTRTYVPKRDRRFEYASEAGEFIERTNCAKGCIHAIDGTEQDPGGSCSIIAEVYAGMGEPVKGLTDGGMWIRCEKRQPPPKTVEPPPQEEKLW